MASLDFLAKLETAIMNSKFSSDSLDRMRLCGVIAVLVIDDAKHAVPVARALLAGGIDIMELTLRTPAAIDSLTEIRQHVPEMMAGIGTILTIDQLHSVKETNAHFGVAPGLNPKIVAEADRIGLPFAPGIVTPSDVEAAIELGCQQLKFFPAEPSGGLKYLKSLAAPYAHLGLQYVPLGGVTTENLATYLAEPMVLAVGGSWLAPRDLIAAEDWLEITKRATEATTIARQTRGTV